MRSLAFVAGSALAVIAATATVPSAPTTRPNAFVAAPAAGPAACRLPPMTSLVGEVDVVELLLATTPDPRVPRHRRFYDHTIAAIDAGMLEGGYVLDRFGFPWQDSLRAGASAAAADDGCYGWMLFRQDAWRDLAGADDKAVAASSAVRPVRDRLVLLVPETASYGVARQALDGAIDTVSDLIREGGAHRLATYPGCATSGDGAASLVVIGPSFSGSIESLLRAAGRLGSDGRPSGLCAVTASATASSNAVAEKLADSRPPRFRLIRLAVSDTQRMLALAKLSGIPDDGNDNNRAIDQVAFLTEASVFGKDLCPDQGTRQYDGLDAAYRTLCDLSLKISFPANIADLRRDAGAAAARGAAKVPLKLPVTTRRLSLDEAADNGSEFPEGLQTYSTAVSAELQLDAALDRLAASHARIIVVVATDVRDRLFLFQQIRERLPESLLVDFSADRLLGHPDGVLASRGALVLASSELLCAQSDERYCWSVGETLNQLRLRRQNLRLSAWPTDHHAIQAKAVSRLGRDSPGRCPSSRNQDGDCATRTPLIHIVGFDGLHSLASRGGARYLGQRAIPGLAIGLLAFVVSALWLLHHDATMDALLAKPHSTRLRRWLLREPASKARWRQQALIVALPVLAVGLFFDALDYAVNAMVVVFALLLSLLIEQQAGYSGRMWAALRNDPARRDDGGHRGHLGGIIGVLLLIAVIALLIVGEVLWWCRSAEIATQLDLDVHALRALALNSSSGLAWFIAMVLTQVTLALVCTLLLTGLAANTRNARLLPNETPLRLLYERFLDWKDPVIGLVVVPSIAVALIVGFGGLRRSVFGDLASGFVLAAITATTISAMILLAAQFNVARRVLRLSAYVSHRIVLNVADGGSAGIPGLWRAEDIYFPLRFAATPVVATVESSGEGRYDYIGIDRLDAWRQQIAEDLGSAPDKLRSRLPLFLLFASELMIFRGAAFGAVIAALAGVLIVYLFPVTAAGSFVGINVAVLAVAGLLSGLMAVQFERDEVLSNILCNRTKETKFSTALFAYIAFPFVVLAAAIAISEIPGMLDWGGGVISWVIGKLGSGL